MMEPPRSWKHRARRAAARRQATMAALALHVLAGFAHAETVGIRSVALGEVLEIPAFSAPATVVARNTPQVASEISAEVTAIQVEVGDRVAPGDVLARLDCRRHESLLAAAEARLERAIAQRRFADRQLARARNLKRNNSISDETMDQRRTDLVVAQADEREQRAAVAEAGLDVERCVVRSPLQAVVSARLASVGSHVVAGDALLGLIETEGAEVSIALRSDQLEGFGSAGEHRFEANGEKLALAPRSILAAADSITRTREARLRFTGREAVPGTAGRVTWEGARNLIPADYLVRRRGRLGILTVDGDRAKFIAVPAAEEGRPAETTLSPSLRLVTEGRQRVDDGDRVTQMDAP